MGAGIHPDWLALGERVRTVRRFGRAIAHQAEVIVVRQTDASVYVRYPVSIPDAAPERYVRRGREYVLTPRYLDYVETLEPLDGGAR